MFNGLTRWVIGVINSPRYIGIGGLIAVQTCSRRSLQC